MMTRRTVLRLVSLSPAILHTLHETHEEVTVPLLVTAVAGYRFADGPLIEDRLESGEKLTLRRESDNAHDTRAIAVFHGSGARLGWVPRRLNEIPARLFDAGFRIAARITDVTRPPAPPWQRLTITLYLCPAGERR